jgi:hypothetical protein
MNIHFDNLQKSGSLCYLGYSVIFELSDNSMEYLHKIIAKMPYVEDGLPKKEALPWRMHKASLMEKHTSLVI